MPASAPLLRPVEGGADVVDGETGPELKRGDEDVEVVGDAVVAEADMLSVSTAGVSEGGTIVAIDIADAVVNLLAAGGTVPEAVNT